MTTEIMPVTPGSLLKLAVEQGADLDKLQKLMDLQDRWEASEARKAYNEAMGKFRRDCPTISKTRESYNGAYAGLAETLEQIKALMADNGLSHSWKVNQDNGSITVTCCITHALGHQECTSMTAPADNSGKKNPIQAIASTITYLERYTLYAILGLASKEDDNDGDTGYVEKINAEQIANIECLITETGSDKAKLLRWLKINSIDQINAAAYGDVIKALEKKRK